MNAGAGIAAVLLSVLLAAPLDAQWPPWLAKKETKPPVFPEIAVDPAWLREHREEVVIVDARGPSEFRSGHIPEAFSLPAEGAGFGPEIGSVLEGSRGSGRGTIVCCGGRDAPQAAARLFWLLELAGAKEVRLLNGGFESWAAAGGPSEKTERVLGGWSGSVPMDPSPIATLGYMADHYGGDGFEVIDFRDSASWEGRLGSGPGETRSGHIPHALPFDPCTVLAADGTILTGPEIRAVFSEVGPRPQTRIDIDAEMLLYDDGLSGDGAFGYLLLRMAGIEKVRYFPGGWPEWASDPALPAVRVVSAGEVEKLLNGKDRRGSASAGDLLVIDVRDRRDYGFGHVPGSVCIPSYVFRDSLDAILGVIRPGLDRAATPLATYCYGSDCIRSRQCATWAARAGFRDLLWFRGGIDEWKQRGLNVDSEIP